MTFAYSMSEISQVIELLQNINAKLDDVVQRIGRLEDGIKMKLPPKKEDCPRHVIFAFDKSSEFWGRKCYNKCFNPTGIPFSASCIYYKNNDGFCGVRLLCKQCTHSELNYVDKKEDVAYYTLADKVTPPEWMIRMLRE